LSLSVSDETIVVIEKEELLSDFSSHSENEAVILNLRAVAGVESQIPEGTVAERVEDILPDSEIDNALQKAHKASTCLCRLSCS
jgi:hypothetical protein